MMSASSTLITFLAIFICVTAQRSREDRFRDKWLENPLIQERHKAPNFVNPNSPGEAFNQAPEESVDIQRLRNLRRDVFENGCVVNLCFLLEGSNVVSEAEFTEMKNFADLIVAITTTDDPGNYCAAEFSDSFKTISRLTQHREIFLNAVQSAKKSGGGANLNAGISFGLKQLARQNTNANKIIFFSKQKPANGPLPLGLNRFFQRGGAVCAVAFDNNYIDDLARYTGDINRVVPLEGFFDLSEIVIALVTDVCSLPCGTRQASRDRFGPGTPRDCPQRLGDRPRKTSKPTVAPRVTAVPRKKF